MKAQEIVIKLGLTAQIEEKLSLVQVERTKFTGLCTELNSKFGLRLALFYATDDRGETNTFGLHAIFSLDTEGEWLEVTTSLPNTDPSYESLTKTIMAAHWYERYAMDMFGLVAEGHPDPRRLVHHENIPLGTFPLRKDFAWDTKLEQADEAYPMHHVMGEGIYEIPVGPIHAGIIEPGHFRFNVAGERIITLEGKLFFTHKGVEKLLEGKTPTEALPFVERISGDMAASHALAFCQAVEAIADAKVPARALAIRSLLCELERLTMHVHDISNMCGMGTGFTVMAAQGFKLKEQLVQLSEKICGNRFWRGLIVPGGLAKDLTDEELKSIRETVARVSRAMQDLILMGRHQDGLRERLETTGVLKAEAARAYGAVGLPARASGLNLDVRRDHVYAFYSELKPEIVVLADGDVYARFKMRYRELEVTANLIDKIVKKIPAGATSVEVKAKDGSALSAVESWRGELISVVYLKDGKITRCVPRDPSFCNWALFGEIGPGNIVPDFPLCNKSLNLSYSGTDL